MVPSEEGSDSRCFARGCHGGSHRWNQTWSNTPGKTLVETIMLSNKLAAFVELYGIFQCSGVTVVPLK